MLSAYMSLLKEVPQVCKRASSCLEGFNRQRLTLLQVDWEAFAAQVGHKYARNAKPAFMKVWEKLKGADPATGSSTDKSTTSASGKTAAKKKVGPSNTPRKASDCGAKSTAKGRTKKEEAVKAESDQEDPFEEEHNPYDDKKGFSSEEDSYMST